MEDINCYKCNMFTCAECKKIHAFKDIAENCCCSCNQGLHEGKRIDCSCKKHHN